MTPKNEIRKLNKAQQPKIKNESEAEKVAEEVADILPEVGKIAREVLPIAGLVLAAEFPEAAVILPLIGKLAPIVLIGASELIKEGIKLYDEAQQPPEEIHQQQDNPTTDSDKMLRETHRILEEAGLIGGSLLKDLGDTLAKSLTGAANALGSEDPALSTTLQSSAVVADEVLKEVGDGAITMLPMLGNHIEESGRSIENFAKEFNQAEKSNENTQQEEEKISTVATLA